MCLLLLIIGACRALKITLFADLFLSESKRTEPDRGLSTRGTRDRPTHDQSECDGRRHASLAGDGA